MSHSKNSVSSFPKQDSKFLKTVFMPCVFSLHTEYHSLINGEKKRIYWISPQAGYAFQGFSSLFIWHYGFLTFYLMVRWRGVQSMAFLFLFLQSVFHCSCFFSLVNTLSCLCNYRNSLLNVSWYILVVPKFDFVSPGDTWCLLVGRWW